MNSQVLSRDAETPITELTSSLKRKSFKKKIKCHAPLPKIRETESRRESATYIREENTSRIHAKPKVTWTSYKSKP